MVTWLLWLPGYCGYLVTVVTLLLWLPGYCGYLVTVVTWLLWLPRVTGQSRTNFKSRSQIKRNNYKENYETASNNDHVLKPTYFTSYMHKGRRELHEDPIYLFIELNQSQRTLGLPIR